MESLFRTRQMDRNIKLFLRLCCTFLRINTGSFLEAFHLSDNRRNIKIRRVEKIARYCMFCPQTEMEKSFFYPSSGSLLLH